MIPAITMLVMVATAPLADGNQASQLSPATDTPVITCEAKNPELSASSSIQFDANGVDMSEWVGKFKSHVQRNWFVPYKAMSLTGCVIISFHVSKDGKIDTPVVENPSATEVFTTLARNAIVGSNPTEPLPETYQGEPLKFTITFFYNSPKQTPTDDTTRPTDPAK